MARVARQKQQLGQINDILRSSGYLHNNLLDNEVTESFNGIQLIFVS